MDRYTTETGMYTTANAPTARTTYMNRPLHDRNGPVQYAQRTDNTDVAGSASAGVSPSVSGVVAGCGSVRDRSLRGGGADLGTGGGAATGALSESVLYGAWHGCACVDMWGQTHILAAWSQHGSNRIQSHPAPGQVR
jgi:hypothetical protein